MVTLYSVQCSIGILEQKIQEQRNPDVYVKCERRSQWHVSRCRLCYGPGAPSMVPGASRQSVYHTGPHAHFKQRRYLTTITICYGNSNAQVISRADRVRRENKKKLLKRGLPEYGAGGSISIWIRDLQEKCLWNQLCINFDIAGNLSIFEINRDEIR